MRRELQQAAQYGYCTLVWSPWIIAELNCVLTWDWIRRPKGDRARGDISKTSEKTCGEAAHAMMAILLPSFELANPVPPYPEAWEGFPDAWDHPIWAAAVESAAEYVVTTDLKHAPKFDPTQSNRHIHQGIEYLRPQDFLQRIGYWDGDDAE